MRIDFAAAVNRRDILEQNLAASPCIFESGLKLRTYQGYSSASTAYNEAIGDTSADILVLVHQDVYFPRPWLDQITAAIHQADQEFENWGLMGVFGVSLSGDLVGKVWSTGIGRELDFSATGLHRAQSLDEIVLILRCAAGLSFDEGLPGFHLYGTDIVQIAWEKRAVALITTTPVVHNSTPVLSLEGAYVKAYHYMAKKWTKELPIKTTVATLSNSGFEFANKRIRHWYGRLRGNTKNISQQESGAFFANSQGYE